MELTLAECIGLELVLLIDGHNLLQLALLAGHVSQQTPVLGDQLAVFALNLVQTDALILLAFLNFSQVDTELLEIVALLRFQLLGQIFVE